MSYDDWLTTPPPMESAGEDGDCGICGGEGVVDSGGVTPWGAGIDVKCGHCDGTGTEPKPHPCYTCGEDDRNHCSCDGLVCRSFSRNWRRRARRKAGKPSAKVVQ